MPHLRLTELLIKVTLEQYLGQIRTEIKEWKQWLSNRV